MTDPQLPQTYQISFYLGKTSTLQIGKLGRFTFPAGRYTYTGSAKRNIEARIARHQQRLKPLRWHIDYLLASPHARITKIVRSTTPECTLNQKTKGEVIVPRFGASDCKHGCGSHLKYQPGS